MFQSEALRAKNTYMKSTTATRIAVGQLMAKRHEGRGLGEDFNTDIYIDTTPQFDESEDFLTAAEDVAAYVETSKVVTIGDISRAFPQHQRILLTILDHLRVRGRVYWDQWKPAPTMIHAGDKRIPESTYKYTWNTARVRSWQHRLKDFPTKTH